MKVLVVHNRYRLAGGEEETTRLEVLSLRKRGHQVVEYYRDSGELDSADPGEKIRAAGACIYSRRTERDLTALVERHTPDVAHVHNVWPLISPSAYIVLHRLGVPIVQTMHNYRFLSADGLHVPGDPAWESSANDRGLAKWQVGRAPIALARFLHQSIGTAHRCIDRYVCLTEDGAAVFRRFGFDATKISVKSNFVDVHELRPCELHDDAIVYAGRLAPEKGVHILLDAMRLLPDVPLVVIGTGPQEEALHALRQRHRLENVCFMGAIPGIERFEILGRARLVVIPSLFREPQGRVAIEAASLGVPVVASRIGGLPYTVLENETGLLVPPGDAPALANAIRSLYDDEPRLRRMRERARVWAETSFSEEKNYEALMRIYSLAVEERHRRRLPSATGDAHAERVDAPEGALPQAVDMIDERIDVCGLRFSRIGMEDLLRAIERRMATQQIRLSLAPTDSVVLASSDVRLRQILNSVDYLLADGVPVVWAARFLGTPLPERVAGPELFEGLLDLCRRGGHSVFFLGSDEKTVRRVRERIPPDVRIVGHLCPEITKPFDAEASREIAAAINRAAPDFLFVILGAPKQDQWIHDHAGALRAKVIVPIGAAFDWYAGRFVRAPKWMQRCGLEWVARLVQNPRRLWRRYARDLAFPFLVLRHRARASARDGGKPSAPPSAC